MNYEFLSPYIRRAMHSPIDFPFKMKKRIIFDYEIIFIADGICIYEVEGKQYPCKKEDIIFIRPGKEHRLIQVDGLAFSQPHVHFDMCADESSKDIYISFQPLKNIPENERKLIRKDIVDIPVPPVFRLENPEYFRTQLYELIEIFVQKGHFYQLLGKAKMLDILYMIFSAFDEGKSARGGSVYPDMINIKNYIDSNYSQKITLDFLSKMFFINKFYLEENFKKQFGIPVIKYYNRVRFENACKLLALGNSVGRTAEKLDFDNIYAFSRFFKNISGFSPSAYKKVRTKIYEEHSC